MNRHSAPRLGAPLLTLLAGGGCGDPASPAATIVTPVAVDLQQLAAAVKSNLGRGTLVNVWATW